MIHRHWDVRIASLRQEETASYLYDVTELVADYPQRQLDFLVIHGHCSSPGTLDRMSISDNT
jgi:hypothetical protein